MPPNSPVVIHNYESEWPLQFAAEHVRLHPLLPGALIEHIGSTAIAGLLAKPIIDILIGVKSLADIESRIPAIESLRYQYVQKHERVLPQRRYFTKSVAGSAFHIHAVVEGGDFWLDHLAFRDALRADPELASRYAALKLQFAEQYKTDRAAYTDAKAPFIQGVLADIRAARR
jgi:GrpB-like predicted nucleotidyltransferase (UPF0157 family)